MKDFEELLEIAQKLKTASEGANASAYKSPTTAITEAIKKVGEAFSGSWLGYHSRVYYKNFQSPPPGEHFSQEWGNYGNPYLDYETDNAWIEYTASDIKTHIMNIAENPNIDECKVISENATRIFYENKSNIESILTCELEKKTDSFISRLLVEIKDLSIFSETEFIDTLQPACNFITRDTIAAGQGVMPPEHIKLLAKVFALNSPFKACSVAGKIAMQAGSHMERLEKKQRTASRIGTNVFIGHGRSQAWRELKDFINDRLSLPYDEFNRVPIAGMTNVARLSEMLDSAVVAFLVMTAEDETAEGVMQARMNVIHEVGLFQGRLGFSRAIVLLEEGCQEFSNIQGLGQIRFPKGKIGAAFEEIRAYLEHESIIAT